MDTNSSTSNTRMRRLLARRWVVIVLAVAIPFLAELAAVAAEPCAKPIAKVVSIEGRVELRRANDAAWAAASFEQAICPGDSVRVGERSRGALRLTNQTVVRLDERSTLVLGDVSDSKETLLDLILGRLHVITRTPKPYRINTPYVNGNVEGTEFFAEVDDESARIGLFEGHLSVQNSQGRLSLATGDVAAAKADEAPRNIATLIPRDAVQWAIHYPMLFDFGAEDRGLDPDTRRILDDVSALYRRGGARDALARLDIMAEGSMSARVLVIRASLFLSVGRFEEALKSVSVALERDPFDADAYSIRSIVAVAQNDKERALAIARQAVGLKAASPAPWIALSYAEQAKFDTAAASQAIEDALRRFPKSALLWSRMADLRLIGGDSAGSLRDARRAVELGPDSALAWTALGFAQLVRPSPSDSSETFSTAIKLDQGAPFPRLGLGIAKIRRGELSAGREDIETAISLDPESSVLRSYLGKAYYEERRDPLASSQFDLARERDPLDPTPWFYSSVLRQQNNDPVGALSDVERSLALNDFRAVYRTPQLLADDLATRIASEARTLSELNFDRVAVLEGRRALEFDVGSSSAHRFVSDSYAGQPNGSIVRASELLQSQIRQTTNIDPVSLQFSDDRDNVIKSGVLRDIGPTQIGYREYNAAFNRNGAEVHVDLLGGDRGSFGDQLSLTSVNGRFSFSIGQSHVEFGGFSADAGRTQDSYAALGQVELTGDTALQFGLASQSVRNVETDYAFDPASAVSVRTASQVWIGRVGLHHRFDASSELLFSGMYEGRDDDVNTDLSGSSASHARAGSGEFQYSRRDGPMTLVAGGAHIERRDDFDPSNNQITDVSEALYVYESGWAFDSRLRWTAGAAFEWMARSDSRRSHTGPKLGLSWQALPDTRLRFAYSESMRRRFVANQTLEPTAVSGFDQFFDDPDGTVSKGLSAAVDHRFSSRGWVGLYASRRRLEVPVFPVLTPDFLWRKRNYGGYGYWVVPESFSGVIRPGLNIALTAELGYETHDSFSLDVPPPLGPFTLPPLPTIEGIQSLATRYMPLGITVTDDSGFSARLVTTRAKQDGVLSSSLGAAAFDTNSNFWVTDLTIRYALPQRRGFVSIGARNLFDRVITYQDPDPQNPRFALRRLLFARLSFNY